MKRHSPDRNEIIEAIKLTAMKLGRTPSRSAFITHTGIREYYVLKHFPNWNSAVSDAGLKPDTTNVKIDDDTLLADWGKAVRQLRQIPARSQYKNYGNYSTATFEHHFGPWSQIPNKFRRFAADKPQWSDVLALLPVQATITSNKNCNLVSQEPSQLLKVAHSHKHFKLNDRPVYGNPIDFRGLRHEPVNENGVIFLFGMVARELGYSVEAVQAGFPDCEAKRQIDIGKWQRIRIEFEYESRNFRDHGHSPNDCDVIVCWRHNWQECPDHIDVVELSMVIKQLAKSDE
ncbi:MAG: hypothetical protein WCU00_11080 [Candidatus Latescibacterota bacterium]